MWGWIVAVANGSRVGRPLATCSTRRAVTLEHCQCASVAPLVGSKIPICSKHHFREAVRLQQAVVPGAVAEVAVQVSLRVVGLAAEDTRPGLGGE